jgi:hypothetical protein
VWPSEKIVALYNQPFVVDSLKGKFILTQNKDTIPHQVRQIDAVRLEIASEKPWGMDSEVKLEFAFADTTQKTETLTRFNTVGRLRMANLRGTIPGGDSTTVVQLTSLDKGRKTETQTAKCNAQGAFEMQNLLDGHYKLIYFQDLNGDGKLSAGSVWTSAPGEPWRLGAEDLILPAALDNDLKLLVKELPVL